jgi:predicted amino acid dehydrogenase
MKHIVHLSFGSSAINGEHILENGGETIHLTRLGVDHRLELLLQWIKDHSGRCDVIALSHLPPPFRTATKTYQHDTLTQVLKSLGSQPHTLGFLAENLYGTWAFEHCLKSGAVDTQNSAVTMVSGLWQQDIKRVLASQTQNLYFLDPWFLFGVSAAIKGSKSFDRWAQVTCPSLTHFKHQWIKEHRGNLSPSLVPWMKPALDAEILVCCATLLPKIEPRILKNKTIFIDEMTPEIAGYLKNTDVYNAYASRFELPCPRASTDRTPSTLDPSKHPVTSLKWCEVEALAMLGLHQNGSTQSDAGHQTKPGKSLAIADVIEFVDRIGLKPKIEVLYPERQKPLRKFAFVIHPLSQDQLFDHPMAAMVKPLPKFVKNQLEQLVNHAPGIRYGTISGIVSESTGVHTEGLIYSLFGTPKKLLESDPELIYKQLVKISEHAAQQGAQIIGLGAFTKIVGDAGVTVAARSPIAVTTGNSLSAAATLWAARDACRKLGFVKFDRSQGSIIEGRAMVIGATGSIGKACAKILSKLFSEVVITATNGPRLFQLKEEIGEESPKTVVPVTTQPSKFAHDADVIVISTSALAGGVLDLDKVKPGCVICDVSRPLTFKASEVIKRPDILVIESGEIELPGHIKIDCNIGLPDAIVYACLAETAILSLEGRYETFTLSRDIATNKVIEIYKMTKKHGGRLAAIRGPNGIITDLDIELCREHALKKMKDNHQEELVKSATEKNLASNKKRQDLFLRQSVNLESRT